MGWQGVRAFTDALRQVKYKLLDIFINYSYPHCRSIRLWKTYCEDEGVRAVV